jgi:hypothetical protein
MSASIIQSGTFTSDGSAKQINIRSDVDWMEVENYTQMATQQGTGRGVIFRWYRGMAAGTGIEITKADGTDVLNGETMSSGGFTLLDTSDQTPGTLNSTITGISNAAIPVVSNSGTNGLSAGDIVRIIDVTTGQQLGGMDFTVGNNTLSSGTFSLDYMAQIATATTGSWRKIDFDPIYYPRRRFITDITSASSAVVTLSVTHGFTAGQAVRFNVPSAFAMTEIDGLIGNITAVSTANNTITVDIDSSAFTTFAFPVSADVPFTHAQVIPVGETANSTYANTLDDATDNQALIGMLLGAGIDGPAGSSNDVIYWKAGKSSVYQTS